MFNCGRSEYLLTIVSKQREILGRRFTVVKVVDLRPIREGVTPCDQELVCNLVRSDPDVVASEDVDLVNFAKLVRPFLELKVTVFSRNVPDTSNEWDAL